MSQQQSEDAVLPAYLQDRYAGKGGLYIVVNGERFPADEAGNALPHTLNADGTPVVPAAPPSEEE